MDRRNPSRQTPKADGRRATDPILTTRDCANRLGVSTDFIVGEIQDGRLTAYTNRRGRRAVYRVAPADFDTYVAEHWRRTAARTARAARTD